VSRSATIESQREAILRSLAILLAGLGVSFYLAWRIGRQITRPILALTHTVSRIGDGHLDERVEQTGQAELGVLQRGVNHMAAQLQTMQDQMLERIDQATARLIYQASHDALTGLINRREFEQRLERMLLSALQQDREHALCYMDLDQFKVINDTCGHAAGDELLRQLALLLKGNLRERDTLARLGGDEFALLLENCSVADALEVADTLPRRGAAFPLQMGRPHLCGRHERGHGGDQPRQRQRGEPAVGRGCRLLRGQGPRPQPDPYL
jgi:diguanylate cyclase (GGDEF)-like protein